MMLTQSYAQSFLCLAFGMDPKYVVPKQGNWFNPQDRGETGFKIDTWCAYRIHDTRSECLPFYDILSDGSGSVSSLLMTSTIEVQLVGKSAEYGVQSMAHWTHRPDLQTFLMASGMAILPGGLGDYMVSDFAQDGLNKVLAFNASFDVVWMSEVVTNQQALLQINLPSGVTQIISSGNLTLIY